MLNHGLFQSGRSQHDHGPIRGTNSQNYHSSAATDVKHHQVHLNPAAGHFQPSSNQMPNMTAYNVNNDYQPHDNIAHQNRYQVSSSPNYDLERKVNGLERDQAALRHDFDIVKTLCDGLHSKIETMKKGGWSVNVGPFKDQSAVQLKPELGRLKHEIKEGIPITDMKKANGHPSSDQTKATASTVSLPPHLRAPRTTTGTSVSIPPHLRSAGAKGSSGNASQQTTNSEMADANNPLVIDGNVDTNSIRPAFEPTPPPSSPPVSIHSDTVLPSIETMSPSRDKWMPYHIVNLRELAKSTISMIPGREKIVSFHADFLRNTFGGITWSPGLNYITPASGPCVLRNRTYYTLDSEYEPYLPRHPGDHGAKLTAFFNQNPEEEFGDLENGSSFENVPLFVMTPDPKYNGTKRYIYFGHYSQTRWSDKLDYDRMTELVPQHVKQYWAEELSAVGRPQWVTEQLMKHFFPKPEYDGRMFGSDTNDTAGGTITSEEESKIEEKVMKDVKKYVEELKEWEKDARMKTAMVKKDFILQAFDRADADDPPALRLWWEYLQCMDWKRDFYDMMVQLQSRNPNYFKH